MLSRLTATILSILILISIGYLAKRFGLLKKEHTAVLNPIIVNITMPALIFRAVYESRIENSILIIPLIAIAITLTGMLLAYIIGRPLKLARPTFGAFILMAAIGNTGYLGYPLAIQLFGMENFVRAVFFDLFGTVLIMFTVGLMVAERFGDVRERFSILKELVTFPPMIAFVLGLAIKTIALPAFITDTIGFLADATIPLIMLSIGLMLEVGQVGRYKREIAVMSAVKLILLPLIVAIALGFVQLPITLERLLLLDASMPAFLFSMIIGIKYGLDIEFIPAAAVASTMISLLTVPVWQLLISL